MFRDHPVKFGHHLIVRHDVATIGGIDTDLNKGFEIGVALGDTADRLGGELRSGQPAAIGEALHHGERVRIDLDGKRR